MRVSDVVEKSRRPSVGTGGVNEIGESCVVGLAESVEVVELAGLLPPAALGVRA